VVGVFESKKICLAQMDVTPGHPNNNTTKMLGMIKDAKRDGSDIIVFPEMSIPGYFIGDIWERNSFLKECESCGEKIRDSAEGIIVIYGNVAVDWNEKNEDGRVRKYNACFVAEDREWVKPLPSLSNRNYIIKTLQPNYREFDDNRHFYDYRKYCGSANPLHLPINLKDGFSIGCMLCEDGWDTDYSDSPIDSLADNCCELLVNISCSPFTQGKNSKRNRIFSEKAKSHRIPMVYVNCVGLQDIGKTVYTFDGESCIYDINGNIFTPYKSFEEGWETFSIKNELSERCMDFTTVNSFENDGIGKLYESVKYGTGKFMDRLGIDKVVIGASGGIDSALSAAIFSQILPKENITLVNMPSKYNSDTTKDLAKELAENIGCNYRVTCINESVELTGGQIWTTFQTKNEAGYMGYRTKVLTPFMLENVQARDRSSRILAAWAALEGGVFTCNANKSEMTVGYTTMYGDLGGFLAPLSDLWKTQVYEMSEWFNENVAPIIPKGSIDIMPSAELSNEQNVDFGQKGDPIRYPYHDLLFKSWIERWDRATPEDILEWQIQGVLEKELGWESDSKILYYMFGDDKEAFVIDLERWWNCYQGLAVAKRIQAPPVLAVSRRAFGFDHREAQVGVIYTEKYYELKNEFSS